ncbi:MAG: ATP-dependent Clp protease proteolytic subunit [Prevotella sp.]|nr:ATP-dependent Clp protease proteolytic subunit [Staphylococcus sp.]MCM1350934.1 ATP-dependent Clp protease proteolytic subunit [Prevotella sp.]
MYLTPVVIEQTIKGERSFDIYSRLLKDRIILIFGEINDAVSASVIAQLLFLSSLDKEKEIYIYINSPGGSVSSGLAIYDTMHYIPNPCVTIGMGICASMGAFLLASGEVKKRYALKHTKIMIHQPLGGAQGQASDVMIVAEEIIKTKHLLNTLLSKHTGQSLETIEKDSDRDHYMTADEAKSYGLIDAVLEKNDF